MQWGNGTGEGYENWPNNLLLLTPSTSIDEATLPTEPRHAWLDTRIVTREYGWIGMVSQITERTSALRVQASPLTVVSSNVQNETSTGGPESVSSGELPSTLQLFKLIANLSLISERRYNSLHQARRFWNYSQWLRDRSGAGVKTAMCGPGTQFKR